MSIAGVDEAGRGCLAGPVVAAAVILSPEFKQSLLNDSKKLTPEKREEAFSALYASPSIISVGIISPEEIDHLNILNATLKAMIQSVQKLTTQPTQVLIDGNKVPPALSDIGEAIVKGDQKIPEISAASIIAKVTRDRLMEDLHTRLPHYGFNIHKGYATEYHYEQLFKYGPSTSHRRSFNLSKQQSLFT